MSPLAIIIPLAIFIVLFILSCFVLCFIEKKHIFPIRCDRNEHTLQDIPLSNFENLKSKDFMFFSKKSILRGRFYFTSNLENNPIIIFCHGFGAGHEAYLTEINYYANKGFTCIGFDYRGCKLSDGTTSHFGASIQDLTALYLYLEEIDFIKDKPLYLWGHSWGGYTALMGSSLKKVKKVIAFCPFNKPINLIAKQSKNYIKGLATFLIPFRWAYYTIRYGKFANKSSFKQINKTKKPAYIVFGEKDNLIGKINFNFLDNVLVNVCKDKGHNAYNTIGAEEYLQNTIATFASAENKLEYLANVDYKKITEQDIPLLEKTLNFLK